GHRRHLAQNPGQHPGPDRHQRTPDPSPPAGGMALGLCVQPAPGPHRTPPGNLLTSTNNTTTHDQDPSETPPPDGQPALRPAWTPRNAPQHQEHQSLAVTTI